MNRLAFGGFELDPASGELWKGEDCVHIQEQPLKLLLCLLERPGQLVGREELQKRVWTGDIHVGFEDGLNAAAWRLRQALGDSSERPQFIETVPRKGYRFVGKVTPLPGRPPPPSGSFPMPVFRPLSGPMTPAVTARHHPIRGRTLWLAGLAFLALLGATAAGIAFHTPVTTVAIAPLWNVTGDPAVDYFASALSRQVRQDLSGIHDLRVVPLAEGTPQGGGPASRQEADLTLTWTLARDAQGYRITLNLAGSGGRDLGNQVFRASPEDLHDIHKTIAEFVASRNPGRSSA